MRATELFDVSLSQECANFAEIVLTLADGVASHEKYGVFVPPTQQNLLPLDCLIKPAACDARPNREQFCAISHFKPIENDN
jgi:hypothetical protein